MAGKAPQKTESQTPPPRKRNRIDRMVPVKKFWLGPCSGKPQLKKKKSRRQLLPNPLAKIKLRTIFRLRMRGGIKRLNVLVLFERTCLPGSTGGSPITARLSWRENEVADGKSGHEAGRWKVSAFQHKEKNKKKLAQFSVEH